MSCKKNFYCPLRSSSQPIQPDVINEHLARTAGDCHVALCAKTDSNPVNVSQNYALIGALFSLGRQLLYFLKGNGTIVDPEIVDDTVAVVIAAVASTQEHRASGIDPL